jgi:hypothetical protein
MMFAAYALLIIATLSTLNWSFSRRPFDRWPLESSDTEIRISALVAVGAAVASLVIVANEIIKAAGGWDA